MRKLVIVLALLLIVGPPAGLLMMGMLLLPGATCAPAGGSTAIGGDPIVPETTRVVLPVPQGRYWISSRYGWRSDPVTGERAYHGGTDFATVEGTAILAAADGVVVLSRYLGDWGNLIVIEHTVNGKKVATAYAHMWDHGVHVVVGQQVMAGDHIGDTGSSGKSTGPHLHFEVRPGGWGQPTVNSMDWLYDHGAEGLTDYVPAGIACGTTPTPTPSPTPTPTPTPSPTPTEAGLPETTGVLRGSTAV